MTGLYTRKPEVAREAAQRFLDDQRAYHQRPPEYVVVSPRDFLSQYKMAPGPPQGPTGAG